jgi:hypothetical protein
VQLRRLFANAELRDVAVPVLDGLKLSSVAAPSDIPLRLTCATQYDRSGRCKVGVTRA